MHFNSHDGSLCCISTISLFCRNRRRIGHHSEWLQLPAEECSSYGNQREEFFGVPDRRDDNHGFFTVMPSLRTRKYLYKSFLNQHKGWVLFDCECEWVREPVRV